MVLFPNSTFIFLLREQILNYCKRNKNWLYRSNVKELIVHLDFKEDCLYKEKNKLYFMQNSELIIYVCNYFDR